MVSESEAGKTVGFGNALLPILVLSGLILYGLLLRPLIWLQPPAPLEIIFILASCFAVSHQLLIGLHWIDIQRSVTEKLGLAMPAFLILFSIGLIIASWIVSGTIPMLVYWGLRLLDPTWLYLMSFLTTILFSTLTGTSWGSVGTIGIVMMGISEALNGNPGINAGAVIGGAYFGDKMSPLSDTTNLAALASDVDLYDHIHSMMFTTMPAAFLAIVVYTALGFIYPPAADNLQQSAELREILKSLDGLFRFHWLLLVPPAIVLFGSLRRLPVVPVLMVSILAASGLALTIQGFDLATVFASIHKGFDVAMIAGAVTVPEKVSVLLNRGGLYALSEAIITAFVIFVFVGTLDHIRAMPIVVGKMLGRVKSRRLTVAMTLIATGATSGLTSNQYATTFIIGDAFRSRFDRLGIPRKVLSRSIEDTGTMIESMIPWTASAVFMAQTLAVPWSSYVIWQLLSLFSITLAFLFAITGFGCFYDTDSSNAD